VKKKNLFVAFAALVAAANACALTRTHEGAGEAVLVPYYHAADGESTLVGMTNHTDFPKVVRVAIAEGRNGRVALAFNVYLSPNDSWSAALVAGGAGSMPRLISNDDTCTVPAIPAGGLALRSDASAGSNDDHLGLDVERYEQGTIELVETGVPTGQAAAFTAVRNCNALAERFAGGTWRTEPQFEIDRPRGGLDATAQILDVAGGVAWSQDPVVFDDFSHAARHGAIANDFADVRIFRPTAEDDFTVGTDVAVDHQHGEDAVSLLLMASALEGGFLLGDSLGASTRWVLTFPTRPAYVDNRPGGELTSSTPPQPPFGDGIEGQTRHCVETGWQVLDGNGEAGGVRQLPMCEHVNVIEFGQDFLTTVHTGHVRVDLHPERHELNYWLSDGVEGSIVQSQGLPVVAQSLTEVTNANAQPGLLASYALTHRIVRTHDDQGGLR
jgi:hypothetical protein